MSTPPYFAPYVDSAGLHVPGLPSINAYLWAAFLSIYGQTINDGNDNADVEWVSILSLMINDCMNTAILVNNNFYAQNAIGAGQDALYKINGIARKIASYSTAVLTISGIAGTIITNGIAEDTNGNFWALPLSVTIPNSGTVNVTGTCQTIGAIGAVPNAINLISQGTQGWTGVTNAAAAVLGAPIEQDSQFRARQSVSIAYSSKTLVVGTLSAIAAVLGVTRYNPGIQTPGASEGTSIENPTGATDSWGNPAHSISMVVEGGTDLAVATAIYNNKTPGCFTNGTTSVAVTDPNTGVVMNIGFFRPTDIPIFVTMVVHGLSGYSSSISAAIIVALTNYLNSLQIGQSLTISALYGAALAVMPNLSNPQFAIEACYASATATGIGQFVIGSAAGTGYVVGDIVTVVQSGASGGQLKVTAIGGSGAVTALVFVAPGVSYTVATGLATSGGTGTGLTINLTEVSADTTTDILITFNEVVSGIANNITVQSI